MRGTVARIQRIHDTVRGRDFLITVEGEDEKSYFLSVHEGQEMEFETEHETEATRITRINDLEQDVTPYTGVPI